jgi:hypothetical protein
MIDIKENAEINILLNKMDEIIKTIDKNNSKKEIKFLDNQEFIQLMNISKRTAQTWRDEGIVAFSQVGGKIYYQMKDIDALLENNLINAK